MRRSATAAGSAAPTRARTATTARAPSRARGVEYDSTRLTTNCHGRNAWRWKGFRCSDAITTAMYDDGTEYTGITIAACALTAQELANPIPEEPDDEVEEDSEEDGRGRRGPRTAAADDDSHALVPGLGR